MKQQLSRAEIVALLFQHGFVRDDERQVHAEGWTRRDERIYLKTGDRFPLVIDPRHEIRLTALLSVPGVVGSSERYAHNSNFTGFDRRMHTGKMPITYGLDFGFQSAAALEAFLDTLSGKPVALPSAEEDVETATDLPTRETERQAVIAARRGQGLFRELLDRYWGMCAVTACTTRALLRASHIRPWRESSNVDRLNPDNGLLLAAHLDAAFDQGLISFADDGRILIHARLPGADAEAIGISAGMRLRNVRPEHRPFLARHRKLHGFP
ncbi:MAG TPA: HNH endonuclease [Stenotrophobium sp.]|nr:HNH endonuclease [Stenotrophobium sp.]